MKAIVKSATLKKEGEGQHGKWYLYEIQLEGDDKKYQYMSKSADQTKFIAGKEAEFTVEEKVNGQYTNYNIKPVQQGGFGGGANNGARLELDRKIAALNAAVQLVNSGKIPFEQMKGARDKFLNEYL